MNDLNLPSVTIHFMFVFLNLAFLWLNFQFCYPVFYTIIYLWFYHFFLILFLFCLGFLFSRVECLVYQLPSVLFNPDSIEDCMTFLLTVFVCFTGFPSGLDGKESACNEEDLGSVPGSETSPGEGNGYPLWYSCLENSMDREALEGYSPWDRKEPDTAKQLTLWLLHICFDVYYHCY